MKRTGNRGKLGIPKFESPKVTEVIAKSDPPVKMFLILSDESDESDENPHKTDPCEISSP